MAKLSRDVAESEGQLDRAQRDKQSLTKQLEETFCKISRQEQDRNKVVSVKAVYSLSCVRFSNEKNTFTLAPEPECGH